MTQMGGVQEENHLVALSPPGGLHVHCPGELVPAVSVLETPLKRVRLHPKLWYVEIDVKIKIGG